MTEFIPTPLDAPDAQQLLGEFFAWGARIYPGWEPGIGPTADPEEFVLPSGSFLVAYASDGRPVACGGVKRLDDSTGEIKRLFVVPEERGNGVARRLLAQLEQAAATAGYVRVRLDTGDRQPDAVALFETSGYTQIPDYNGNPFASYWYEKLLR